MSNHFIPTIIYHSYVQVWEPCANCFKWHMLAPQIPFATVRDSWAKSVMREMTQKPGFHVVLREEGWMTIGWYFSSTWRCPFCAVTPRIIHGWHFCIETGDPEIRRFEKPPLRWGMAGDLLTRALEGLPCVNTFGWSDDPSNYHKGHKMGMMKWWYIWVNYNISLTWIVKGHVRMISSTNHHSQWGRTVRSWWHLPRIITKNEVLRINIPVVVSPCQCLDNVS